MRQPALRQQPATPRGTDMTAPDIAAVWCIIVAAWIALFLAWGLRKDKKKEDQ